MVIDLQTNRSSISDLAVRNIRGRATMRFAHVHERVGSAVMRRTNRAVPQVIAILLGFAGVAAPFEAIASPTALTQEPLTDVSLESAALQLAADWSVPVAEARQRMARQPRLTSLAEVSASRAGSAWAGAWLDQANSGALVLQATDEHAVATIREAIPSDLLPYVSLRVVRYSEAELVAGADAIRRTLADSDIPTNFLIADPITNGIKVAIAPDNELTLIGLDPAAVLERVNDVVSQYPITGSIERVAGSVSDSCLTAYRVCDANLRGGVEITQASVPQCTSGFMVKSLSGTHLPYVLTAGHCIEDTGGNNQTWTATKTISSTQLHTIGIAWSHTANTDYSTTVRDFGIIRIDNTSGWPSEGTVLVAASSQTINGVTYTTTRNEHYPISAVANFSQIPNGYLCKTGETTGTTCGPAVGINTTTSLAMMRVTACNGDSGAPYYIAGKGYGIHVSHSSVGNIQTRGFWTKSYSATVDCYSSVTNGTAGYASYQGLAAALNLSNVEIL